jgi:hypothetical protein
LGTHSHAIGVASHRALAVINDIFVCVLLAGATVQAVLPPFVQRMLAAGHGLLIVLLLFMAQYMSSSELVCCT